MGAKKCQDYIAKLRYIKEVLISLLSKGALGDGVLSGRTETAKSILKKKLTNTNLTEKIASPERYTEWINTMWYYPYNGTLFNNKKEVLVRATTLKTLY